MTNDLAALDDFACGFNDGAMRHDVICHLSFVINVARHPQE